MNSDRWAQIEELFHRALESDLEGRARLLDEAGTGDPELRKEVESLMSCHGDAGGHLQLAVREAIVSAGFPLAGETVTHYRLLCGLGAGGMGVVYRAEDLTLERPVALKFLPGVGEAGGSPSAAALERFRREARAAATLNHPNICTIYEVCEQADQPFIAMELLEGQTLKELLCRKGGESLRLRTDQLLDLGMQIAAGLDAAHTRGIVHRDIKPANIFVTLRGQVKILDFGLSKVAAPELENDHLTTPGLVMGTLAYMSPEQARGEALNARTDLFSLGAVLYEMAAGRQAFGGASTAVTLHNILAETPPPVREFNQELPPGLVEMISKALEKDQDLRCQSAAEICAGLKRLKRDSDSSRPRAASPPDMKVLAVLRRPRALAIALVIVAGAFGYAVHRLKPPAGPPGSPFQNFAIAQLTGSGDEVEAAISPDGKYILSARENNRLESLWLRNVATASGAQVIAPAPAHYANLAFSPDGDYIYYRKLIGPGAFNLFRIPVLGGAPKAVVHDIDSNIAFSPDGRRMAWVRLNDPVIGQGRLLSASVDGSGETTVHVAPANRFSHRVAWSPDGRRIATPVPGAGNALPGIATFDAASGSFRTFATLKNMDVHSLAWIPDGSGLVVSYANAQSDYRLQIGFLSYPRAKFSAITRDTNSYPNFTMSADGKTIATVQQNNSSDLDVLPASGSEASAPAPVLSVPEQVQDYSWDGGSSLLLAESGKLLRVSVDGKTISSAIDNPEAVFRSIAVCAEGRLVFSMALPRAGSGPNIWRASVDGTDAVQLTKGNNDYGPVCSADGKWVYYFQFLPSPAFKRVPFSGGASQDMPQWAVPGVVIDSPASQSADGRQIAFLTNAAKDALARVVLLSPDSGQSPRFVTPDPRIDFSAFWQSTAQFTPDGKALAYPIRQNGAGNIWVQPLDGSSGRQITHFTSERIFKFSWSPDGKQLAVLRTRSASNVILLRAANP